MTRLVVTSTLALILAGALGAQPVLTSLSPSSGIAGSGAFTLTLTGTGFAPLNVVQWNGGNLPTTMVNSTTLTATVAANLLVTGGVRPVRVRASLISILFSNSQNFTVNNPAPTFASMSPTTANIGSGPFTISLTGTGFNASTTAHWNLQNLATTLVSPTNITAVVTNILVQNPGTATVNISNPTPGGGSSAGRTFNVTIPVPTLLSASPNPIRTGSPNTALTLAGTNFVPGSTVRVNGTLTSTTFVSGVELSALVSGTFFQVPGTVALRVSPPAPSPGDSNTVNLIVQDQIPTLNSISPSILTAGAFTSQSLTANGANFAANAVVVVDGTSLTPTSGTSASLSVSLPPSLLATLGSKSVVVQNPGSGGGTSSPRSLAVLASPNPTITGFNPAQASVGAPGQVLQVLGSGFTPATQVRVGLTTLATVPISATRVDMTLPSTFTMAAGILSITVVVPTASIQSTSAILNIHHPVPILSSVTPSIAIVGAPFLIVLTGAGFNAESVIQIDGASVATSLVSGTLRTTLSSALSGTAGNHTVRVVNPSPGGGTSASLPLVIQWPVPTLTAVSPDTVPALNAPASLTVTGTGFTSATTANVLVPFLSLPVTLVSSTELTVTVPAPLFAAVGNFQVRVANPLPGGGITPSATVTVVNPLPEPAAVVPSSLVTSATDQTVTIQGARFQSGITVRIGASAPLATTFQSSTVIHTVIPASFLATEGSLALSLRNPDPTLPGSADLLVMVAFPTPTAFSLTPSTANAGASTIVMSVAGANFHPVAIVEWDGSPLATTYLNAFNLSATVPASRLATAGTASVRVRHGSAPGTVSNVLTFTVQNPTPVILSVFPPTIPSGQSSQTVSILGSEFLPGGTLSVAGNFLPVIFQSSSLLTFDMTAQLLATAAIHAITYANPAPTSGAGMGSVAVVGPSLNGVIPSVLPIGAVGGPTVQVTLSGSNFVTGNSLVIVDGVICPSNVVSSTSMTASIFGTHPGLVRPGALAIAVQNSILSQSNARAIRIGGFSNQGTIVTHPLAVLPGTPFSLVIEGVPVATPFTLVADLAPAAPIAPFPDPITNQVLGVLAGPTIPLIDGLGAFGPPSGAAFSLNFLGTDPFGEFTLPGLVMPNPPAGLSVALQAAYPDPSSPIGLRLTWIRGPLSL